MINTTHRTVIEPILISCLKPPIQNLSEIGGQLNLLEDFDIEIRTDSDGNRSYNAFFRGQKYELDWDKVREFAQVKKD